MFNPELREHSCISVEKKLDYFKFMFNRCKFYLPDFGETRTLYPLNRTASIVPHATSLNSSLRCEIFNSRHSHSVPLMLRIPRNCWFASKICSFLFRLSIFGRVKVGKLPFFWMYLLPIWRKRSWLVVSSSFHCLPLANVLVESKWEL